MYGTDHEVTRPTRTVTAGSGERYTIRVRPPGRSTARRSAIREQMAGVR